MTVDKAPKEPTLDTLYKQALADGHPKGLLGWRHRLAKARARLVVAEAQHHRYVSEQMNGKEVHDLLRLVYQEMADASGALAFCQEMVKETK